jgi:drug/metabolite transporter (DMT)-like permease
MITPVVRSGAGRRELSDERSDRPLVGVLAKGLLPRPRTATLAVMAMTGAALLWGTSFVAAKAVLAEVPPTTLALLRFAIAAIVLVPLARRGGSRPALGRRGASLGLSGIALFYVCENAGLRFAGA